MQTSTGEAIAKRRIGNYGAVLVAIFADGQPALADNAAGARAAPGRLSRADQVVQRTSSPRSAQRHAEEIALLAIEIGHAAV